MEYKEAIEWLFAQLPMFSRTGAAAYKPGLERSEKIAAFFNNPHKKFKSIHVAGTNGKGSVSNLIAAVLQSQGYKTALYTSPHLVDFRERMIINGRMIPEKNVVEFVEKWKASHYEGERPSFFELTMVMAFDWFANENVDYAVIEVGMGGRLDSTNIIQPILSVITNISKDHTQFLGETLESIACEKAGIIKNKVPVVIGEADEDIEAVFKKKAFDINAPFRAAYKEINEKANEILNCSLLGDYQKKNINTARIAIDELRRSGVSIDDPSIQYGFKNVSKLTGLKGRWTILDKHPLQICDTGHNAAGLSYNIAQLNKIKNQRKNSRLRFVIGFVSDKDITGILKLFPDDADYYLTQAKIPRALPYCELHERFSELHSTNRHINKYPDVEKAYHAALSESKPDDIIFIGGSTFIVADFLSEIKP